MMEESSHTRRRTNADRGLLEGRGRSPNGPSARRTSLTARSGNAPYQQNLRPEGIHFDRESQTVPDGSGGSAAAATAFWSRPARARHQARRADVLIRGGHIHDGSLRSPERGDVAIGQGRILAVGDLATWSAARTIDAAGRVVTPGFIDAHSHAAESLVRKGLHSARGAPRSGHHHHRGQPRRRRARRSRGATRTRFGTLGLGVNVAPLVGHGAIRGSVLGGANRAPTAAERDRMRDLVRAAMRAGAFGLSSGLFYTPGAYAATDEVTDLMRVAAETLGRSAVHTSHIRDEGTYSVGVLAAVDEIIAHRRRLWHHRHRHAHEGTRPRCLGHDARVRRTHRCRARARRGRVGRSVPVRGVFHEHVRRVDSPRGSGWRAGGVRGARGRPRRSARPCCRRSARTSAAVVAPPR